MGFWKGLFETLFIPSDLQIVRDPTLPTFDRMQAQRRLDARQAEALQAARERDIADAAEEASKRRSLFEELGRTLERLVGRLTVGEHDQAVELAGVLLAGIEQVDRAGWAEYLNPAWLASAHVSRGSAHMGRYHSAPAGHAAELDAAERAFEAAARLAPHESWPVTQLGVVARARGRYQTAVDWFTRAISTEPGDARPRAWRGRAYHEMGLYAEAVEDLEKAWRLDPHHDDLAEQLRTSWKAWLRATEAMADEAVALAKVRPHNVHPETWDGAMAWQASRNAHLSKALALYTDVLTRAKTCPAGGPALRKPERVALLLKRADTCLESTEPPDVLSQGIADCHKAIRLEPNNKTAHLLLAELYGDSNDSDRAARCYRRVLRIDPDDEQARERLREYHLETAWGLMRDRRYGEAVRHCRRAWRYAGCEPNDDCGWHHCFAHLLNGDEAEARGLAERLSKEGGWKYSGDVYWGLHDYRGAAEEYARHVEDCNRTEWNPEQALAVFAGEENGFEQYGYLPPADQTLAQLLTRPGRYKDRIVELLGAGGRPAESQDADTFFAAWTAFATFPATLPVTQCFEEIAGQVDLTVPRVVAPVLIGQWLLDPERSRKFLGQPGTMAVRGLAGMVADRLKAVCGDASAEAMASLTDLLLAAPVSSDELRRMLDNPADSRNEAILLMNRNARALPDAVDLAAAAYTRWSEDAADDSTAAKRAVLKFWKLAKKCRADFGPSLDDMLAEPGEHKERLIQARIRVGTPEYDKLVAAWKGHKTAKRWDHFDHLSEVIDAARDE